MQWIQIKIDREKISSSAACGGSVLKFLVVVNSLYFNILFWIFLSFVYVQIRINNNKCKKGFNNENCKRVSADWVYWFHNG